MMNPDDRNQPINYTDPIAAKIQQRRYQILVHSYLYYELNTTIVSDSKWSEWAVELANLQVANPELAELVIFASAFRGFDGSSGYDLPYMNGKIVEIGNYLLKIMGQDKSN